MATFRFSMRTLQLSHLNSWWSWGVLSTLLLLATVASGVINALERHQLLLLTKALSHANGLRGQVQAPGPAGAATDFTSELPGRTDVPAVLAELQRACTSIGLALLEVRVEERAPGIRDLGVAQLTVQFRGTYPNLKQVLIEVQSRFPAVTLRRLSLRRAPLPSLDTDGTATLAVYAQPLRPSLDAAAASSALVRRGT